VLVRTETVLRYLPNTMWVRKTEACPTKYDVDAHKDMHRFLAISCGKMVDLTIPSSCSHAVSLNASTERGSYKKTVRSCSDGARLT
jgi:hypothetical protein